SVFYLRDVAGPADGSFLTLAASPCVSFDAKTRQSSGITGNAIAQAFSPSGELFASSGTDLEVHRVQQGKIESRVFPIVCKGGTPAFSSDGKYMAVLNADLTQVLRLPADDALARKIGLRGRYSWAAFSPNGKYVAPNGSTAGLSSVRIIQVRATGTGEPIGEALTLDADLVAADFSPDSSLIASVTGIHGQPAQLRIWNWQTGSQICPPVHFDAEPVWTRFAPDGKAVAVHCMNGDVFLIDPTSGSQLLHLTCKMPRQTQGTYPWMSGRGTIGFSHD